MMMPNPKHPPSIERIREVFDYEPTTGVITRKVKRGNNGPAGKVVGADLGQGYLHVSLDHGRYLSHRLAWAHYYGEWPTQVIDHIDGNGHNNEISNLRDVAHRENSANMLRNKSMRADAAKWRAHQADAQALAGEIERLRADAALLDALRENSWNLVAFDMQTGSGDADVGWRVIGHYMSAPNDRTIGEVYEDDPRAAIVAALSACPSTGKAGGKVMSKRLAVLQQSLAKKEAAFDAKLGSHFSSVRATNGQPLNDKRNGAATLRRFESQNDSLRSAAEGIERTKNAIERERGTIARTELVADTLPQAIKDRLADGTLVQWRKHPSTFFVAGVDKARIVVLDDGKTVAHRYLTSITDPEQRRIFARTFNEIRAWMVREHADCAAAIRAGGEQT